MVPIEAFVPYDKGDLLNDIHKVGMVEKMVSVLFDKRYNFYGSSTLSSLLSCCEILCSNLNVSKLIQCDIVAKEMIQPFIAYWLQISSSINHKLC
jgi:hypothetical protein